MDKSEEFIKTVYEYKGVKEIYKNKLKELRYYASLQFRERFGGWFKTLDIIGIILILLNIGALLMTGLLVINTDPGHSFAEANPVQCSWNGFSCHDDWSNIFGSLLKQILLWSVFVVLYIYTRNNTFNITGLWILTIAMIFYSVAIGLDFTNDLGLYLGKVAWGV